MKLASGQKRFQSYIIIAITVLVFGFYIFASWHSYIAFFASALIGAFFYLFAHFELAFRQEQLKTSDAFAAFLLSLLHIVGAIVIVVYACRLIGRYGLSDFTLISIFAFCMLVAAALLGLLYIQLQAEYRYYRQNAPLSLPKWKSVIVILCLLVFLAIINIGIFDTWPRWDNYAYLTELMRLDLHSLFSISDLRVANHATYAYSFLCILLNSLFNNPNTTAYLLNYIYLLIGTLCFWNILCKIFPKWHWITRVLATCVFAFSPYFLGQMTYINLEFFSVLAILLFLAGEANELRILQFIGALFLCFGKESTTVILVFMMLARILAEIIKRRPNDWKGWISSFELPFSLPVLSIGLLWLWDLLQNNWMLTNQTEFLTVDGKNFNSFGFSMIYVWDKLKTIVCANFDWICILGCILACIVWVLRLRKNQWKVTLCFDKNESVLWFEICGVFVGGLLMQVLFITYNHIRYNSSVILAIYFFFFLALDILTKRQGVKNAVCCIFACVLLAQCYYTVDPVMLATMPRLDMGNGYIVSSENHVIGTDAEFIDSVQYNRQIRDFDITFDKLLSEIQYSSDACVAISSEYEMLTAGGVCSAIHLILGYGYPYYVPSIQYVAWDETAGSRTLSLDSSEQMNVVFISSLEELETLSKTYSRVYYFRMPWKDSLYDNQLNDPNLWEDQISAGYHGWNLHAYEYSSSNG